jgi:two-component system LytT family response regulator
MIRTLLVDDEPLARAGLRALLAREPDVAIVGEAGDGDSAMAGIREHKPDLVLLDVQMPGIDGIEVVRRLASEPLPAIVFVTAHDRFAVQAFEVHALDYLLKPLNDARLAQAVERIGAMLGQRQREAYGAALRDYVDAGQASARLERINVRSVGRIEQIRVADILWVESAGNYVELHLAGRTVLHRITLNRIETLLAPEDFLRVHRGAIVRRGEIARLDSIGDGSYRLSLRCGATVAVSERYLGALKSTM